jgi:hypothetical protein
MQLQLTMERPADDAVVAPALRPGDPRPDRPDDPPNHVSRRNAAELQG